MSTTVRRIDSHARSVGELLGKSLLYRVPAYQRDFAWTKEEIDTIWEDLLRAFEEDGGEYFLGAIVTSRQQDQKEREVVDGQQRLVVMSMLFGIISKEWERLGDTRRHLGVSRDYLGTENRRTNSTIPKLRLNNNNDLTFQRIVIDGKLFSHQETKGLNYSNRLIVNAFTRLSGKLSNWLEDKPDEDALIDFELYLAENVNVIEIDVDNNADAFAIFETLNDRGLDLAVADLVKNYLFSQAGQHQINQFQTIWGEISVLVGSQHVTQFLRHYWLSRYPGVVRERDLYRALRQEVKGANKARSTMEQFRVSSRLYAALLNSDSETWNEYSLDARLYHEALVTFSVTQYRPVALAAMEVLPAPTVAKILKVLMVTSFRYTVVSGLGTGNLERIYATAALSIRNGECRSVGDLFKRIEQIYVKDDKFRADFCSKRFTKAAIARYILAQINAKLEKDPEHTVNDSGGQITLEHIMPKVRNAEWDSIDEGQAVQSVDLIGNLTLLEKGKNRGISNAGFATKCQKAFNQSSLGLNKVLADKDSWTIESIEQRSFQLAKIATDIWRLDLKAVRDS